MINTITVIAMIITAVIGFATAVVIVLLDCFAVFSWAYSMEKAVCRYNYFASIKAEKAAKAWRKIIKKRLLEGSFDDIKTFIREIGPNEHSSFDLSEIFNKCSMEYLGYWYEHAADCRKEGLVEMLGSLAQKKIATENLLFLTNFQGYENFFRKALIPAIKENLSEISSLQVLKEWRANCTERVRLLINEREIEVIQKNPPQTFSDFFELFLIIECASPVRKYLTEKFTEFLTNREYWFLTTDHGGAWWNSDLVWRKNQDCLIEGQFIDLIKEYTHNPGLIIPIQMCLEVALPNLDETDIEYWFPCFSHNPEYVAHFAERLLKMYKDNDWKSLIPLYEKYRETALKEVFEELLEKCIQELIIETCGTFKKSYDYLIEAWLILPFSSRARDLARAKSYELIERGIIHIVLKH